MYSTLTYISIYNIYIYNMYICMYTHLKVLVLVD